MSIYLIWNLDGKYESLSMLIVGLRYIVRCIMAGSLVRSISSLVEDGTLSKSKTERVIHLLMSLTRHSTELILLPCMMKRVALISSPSDQIRTILWVSEMVMIDLIRKECKLFGLRRKNRVLCQCSVLPGSEMSRWLDCILQS